MASLRLPPDPERFVSQTEFQSFLFHFLRESVMEEKRFSITREKLEAWINWIMANPGDEDLNVFEMFGLEDEIRSAVLPQLEGFEEEQWGHRNTGAVLDAWVRQAFAKGAISESVLRESVRDLLTLWQDTSLGRGKDPSRPPPVIAYPTTESMGSSSNAPEPPLESIDKVLMRDQLPARG